MAAYLNAMRNYAVFRGRTSRAGFWRFYLVYCLIGIGAALLDQALGTASRNGGVLVGLVNIMHLLPQIAVSVRRIHDGGHRGWWLLLTPAMIIFAFLRGTPGPNRFGPAPIDREPGASPSMPSGAAALSAAPQSRDLIEEIERLGALRANGSLSETEFEVLKTQALARSGRA